MQQNKRLTFGRIEIKIFSQSWSMKVQYFIFLRFFVDTLYTVSLTICPPLQLNMQHTNELLQYTSMDTTWHTKQLQHSTHVH